MGSRIELQTILESILESDSVYFQPPPSVIMKYPCIVYERSNLISKFANNFPYSIGKQYTVTVIDSNPDSSIPDKIANLQACVFNRHYKADMLNHDVFIIYF